MRRIYLSTNCVQSLCLYVRCFIHGQIHVLWSLDQFCITGITSFWKISHLFPQGRAEKFKDLAQSFLLIPGVPTLLSSSFRLCQSTGNEWILEYNPRSGITRKWSLSEFHCVKGDWHSTVRMTEQWAGEGGPQEYEIEETWPRGCCVTHYWAISLNLQQWYNRVPCY